MGLRALLALGGIARITQRRGPVSHGDCAFLINLCGSRAVLTQLPDSGWLMRSIGSATMGRKTVCMEVLHGWLPKLIITYHYKTQDFKGFVYDTLLTSVTANKRSVVWLGL